MVDKETRDSMVGKEIRVSMEAREVSMEVKEVSMADKVDSMEETEVSMVDSAEVDLMEVKDKVSITKDRDKIPMPFIILTATSTHQTIALVTQRAISTSDPLSISETPSKDNSLSTSLVNSHLLRILSESPKIPTKAQSTHLSTPQKFLCQPTNPKSKEMSKAGLKTPSRGNLSSASTTKDSPRTAPRSVRSSATSNDAL